MKRITGIAVLLAAFSAGLVHEALAQPPAPLTDRHKVWLEEEAVYIIADKEKEAFLKLPSEELRNQFVEAFWKHRDPTPATSYNEYKEEHYRRIAYANTWYGSRVKNNGWRSDRGRIYILFGEPQEKNKFTGENDIRDCEIWFYDSQGLIRNVAFFRLLFYQKSFGQDFVLYDPIHDGPQELAMQIAPSRTQALRYLWERAGQAVWEASQSFIPSEPLDGSFSAQSAMLIASIEDLHNTMSDPGWAQSFLVTHGRVSTRLSFKALPMDVVSKTLYNMEKEAFLHVGFQLAPENLQVGSINERFYSVFDIRTFVEDKNTGREVYTESDHWETIYPSLNGQPQARPVAAEQIIPLVPGSYKLLWVIDDLVTGTFSFRQAEVEIPEPSEADAFLTSPLVAGRYERLEAEKASELMPFRIFNIQYTPSFDREYNKGDNLSVFCEYLFRPEDGIPDKLTFTVEARPLTAANAEPQVFVHEVPRERISPQGVVLLHRQIPVTKLVKDGYELNITVEDSNGKVVKSERETFRYRDEDILVRPKADTLRMKTAILSTNYYLERSRQQEALGRHEAAIVEVKKGLARFPADDLLKAELERLNAAPASGQ